MKSIKRKVCEVKYFCIKKRNLVNKHVLLLNEYAIFKDLNGNSLRRFSFTLITLMF